MLRTLSQQKSLFFVFISAQELFCLKVRENIFFKYTQLFCLLRSLVPLPNSLPERREMEEITDEEINQSFHTHKQTLARPNPPKSLQILSLSPLIRLYSSRPSPIRSINAFAFLLIFFFILPKALYYSKLRPTL